MTSPRPTFPTRVTNFPIEVYGDRFPITLILGDNLWRPAFLGNHVGFVDQREDLLAISIEHPMYWFGGDVMAVLHHMVDAVFGPLRPIDQSGCRFKCTATDVLQNSQLRLVRRWDR